MSWLFIAPSPHEFTSGGNLYNAQLISALTQLNIDIKRCSIEEYSLSDKLADYVVIDSIYLNPTWEDKMARIRGRSKTIFLAHHLSSLYPGPSELFVWEKKILDQMNLVVATGQYAYKMLKGLDSRVKLTLLPPVYIADPDISELSNNSTMILMVNSLIRRKGVLDFLKIVSIQPLPVPFYIQLVGARNLEPEYAQECLKFAQAHYIPFDYCGQVDHSEISQYYTAANLLVSASWMETFGMQIQEALAYRLPVFALNRGNMPYLIQDGVNGFLVDDHASLYQAIMDYLSGKKTLKTPGPLYADHHHSWSELAEAWKNAVTK